jgi:hypothetical protein
MGVGDPAGVRLGSVSVLCRSEEWCDGEKGEGVLRYVVGSCGENCKMAE